MSIGVYDLRLKAFMIPPDMAFRMERFRLVFRRERERLKLSRKTLADRAGFNQSTVQNLEMYEDATALETVARLVEAMKMSLSEFFSRVESYKESGKAPISQGVKKVTPPVSDSRHTDDLPHDGGRSRAADSVPALPDLFDAAGHLKYAMDARRSKQAARGHRAVPGDRRAGPDRRKKGA